MTWSENTIIAALQQVLTAIQNNQTATSLWNAVIQAWENRPVN